MNAYYTHQETLIKILDSLDYSKPVHCLEFGSGDGSSSIFHSYAQSKENFVVDCYEHDASWLESMKSKYQLPNYTFNVVDWGTITYDNLKEKHYDLIFVDQGDWDARIETIDNLQDNAEYIILHDYCYYNGFGAGMIPSENMDYNSVGENSFFHKYSEKFDLISEVKLFPPTLVMKLKSK